MKIYEFRIDEEREWVAANTVIEAIQTHATTLSMDLSDYNKEDDIVELPESEWDKHTVIDTENEDKEPDMTFREWMEQYKNMGPDIIATTTAL